MRSNRNNDYKPSLWEYFVKNMVEAADGVKAAVTTSEPTR
jgi:hypothetical protein